MTTIATRNQGDSVSSVWIGSITSHVMASLNPPVRPEAFSCTQLVAVEVCLAMSLPMLMSGPPAPSVDGKSAAQRKVRDR
jgi:hypothetical protein